MGYDTTLHVAPQDQELARKTLDFIEGKGPAPVPADYQDMAEQALNILRADIASANHSGIVIGLSYLWLMGASSEHPFGFSFGAALSLWDHSGCEEPIPEEFFEPPAPDPLEPFMRRWPELRGLFARGMAGNWEPGLRVSSAKVPALIDWLQARIAGAPEDEYFQMFCADLLAPLRAAAQAGLGYWEAADLPMAGHPSWWPGQGEDETA